MAFPPVDAGQIKVETPDGIIWTTNEGDTRSNLYDTGGERPSLVTTGDIQVRQRNRQPGNDPTTGS